MLDRRLALEILQLDAQAVEQASREDALLDALFGAFRAWLDGKFNDRVFVVSFVSNVLIAALIVWVGDQIGVGSQLSTGVVVVLGIRIFSNAAAIRRLLFRS